MKPASNIRVAAAVPVVRVADPKANADRIIALLQKAKEQGAQVVITPELSLVGFTCGDLLGHPALLNAALRALDKIVDEAQALDIAVVVGLPLECERRLYNVAALVKGGEVVAVVPKRYLDSRDSRQFSTPAPDFKAVATTPSGRTLTIGEGVATIDGCRVEVAVGEDALRGEYKLEGACPPQMCDVVLNPTAVPATAGSYVRRREQLRAQTERLCRASVMASAGFGESSTDSAWAGDCVVASCGEILAEGVRFSTEGEVTITDINIENIRQQREGATLQPCAEAFNQYTNRPTPPTEVEQNPFTPKSDEATAEIFAIQRAGLMQRLASCGIKKCVVGISGGLDSTLALLVTVAAYDKLNLCRRDIVGITMPGFGTTSRTHRNAVDMMRALGITIDEISIRKACEQHFEDIGLPADDRSATYENAQARERTQILMDYAGRIGGIVVGTGDMSELALGWATYNGDHMSMYGVNCGVPKTTVQHLVAWYARCFAEKSVGEILMDVLDTPISPELLPADESGNIAQQTEDLVGPYQLHDFFLYYMIHCSLAPSDVRRLAESVFEGVYEPSVIKHWLQVFVRRFFSQQFKRSAVPDGVGVFDLSLSPRTDWQMPSDASSAAWLDDLNEL